MQLLPKAQAAVDAANADGYTALQIAAQHGHAAVVQLLLKAHTSSAVVGAQTTLCHAATAALQLTTETMADLARAAAAAGHTEVAVVVLKALVA